MDDAKCAQQVLEGTYIFPEGIDPSTKMLLEECSIMYLPMLREGDYQYYWKRVEERTSFFYSRLHFGHTQGNEVLLLPSHIQMA